jgi:hypothetical protein
MRHVDFRCTKSLNTTILTSKNLTAMFFSKKLTDQSNPKRKRNDLSLLLFDTFSIGSFERYFVVHR